MSESKSQSVSEIFGICSMFLDGAARMHEAVTGHVETQRLVERLLVVRHVFAQFVAKVLDQIVHFDNEARRRHIHVAQMQALAELPVLRAKFVERVDRRIVKDGGALQVNLDIVRIVLSRARPRVSECILSCQNK